MTHPIPEWSFQSAVIALAELRGWLVFHIPDSRRATSAGFPDLVLARHGRLIFAELKSAKGRISRRQQEWMGRLQKSGAEVYVWRPDDMDEIRRVLTPSREDMA